MCDGSYQTVVEGIEMSMEEVSFGSTVRITNKFDRLFFKHSPVYLRP